MVPTFACLPVCTFFAALGLLGFAIVLLGAYNRTEQDSTAPKPPRELTWPWIIAILITIIVPATMLLGIWLLPEW